MALKLLKVSVNLVVKADKNDQQDIRERLYDQLQVLIEGDELEFEVLDDEDEEAEED